MIRAEQGPIPAVLPLMSHRHTPPDPPEKSCAVCGRRMEWRKKWAKNWDEVKYCSDGCRRRKNRNDDAGFEAGIVELLEDRARDATICPSEVARRTRPDDWRPLMEPVREAGRRLAAREVVVFLQGGHPVDPSTAKGPVRLGRGPAWSRRS